MRKTENDMGKRMTYTQYQTLTMCMDSTSKTAPSKLNSRNQHSSHCKNVLRSELSAACTSAARESTEENMDGFTTVAVTTAFLTLGKKW